METLQLPGWDEYFMRHVYLAASKSRDNRTQIGAVIVRDKIILSEGYNGFPRGVKDDAERYQDRELKLKLICHGEFNSILNAGRYGVNICNATLYSQAYPCNECSKAIIQSGINEVVLHTEFPELPERWIESAKLSKMMFEESGVKVRYWSGRLGVKNLFLGNIIEV